MTAADWIKKNIKKFNDRTQLIKAGAKALGLSESRVRRVVAKMWPLLGKSTRPTGKTLKDFTNQFDWTHKIRLKIKETLSNGEASVYTDVEFRHLCEIPTHKWPVHASDEQFSPYNIKIKGIRYWSSRANILKIRSLDI